MAGYGSLAVVILFLECATALVGDPFLPAVCEEELLSTYWSVSACDGMFVLL